MTQAGQLLGTPPYLAPEQVEGRHEHLDRRTDVYSLGATLYELLVGRPPFEAERNVDLLVQILHSEPVAPRRVDPSLPADLETVVLKCLAKERSRRYESARALAEDLRRFLDGESIQAKPASLGYRLTKKARKHKWILATAAILVTIAGAALATVRWRAESRLEYEQRYSQIGRDLDWSLRAVYMSSRHDIRPSKERVRERIRQLEAELAEISSLGKAPAHLAIGRAYAALNEDEAARRHLEAAWDLGQRNAEVGYTLGLVLGRQYESRLEQVRYLKDTNLREEAMAGLREAFRDPAIEYLVAGRGTDAVAAEYVEALLAYYDRRWEQALGLLEEARTKLPWLYETLIVKGNVLNALGDERRAEGAELESSRQPYAQAEQAYRAAIASAGSDPRAYLGLCQLHFNLLRLEVHHPSPQIQVHKQNAFEACGEALAIDPEQARAHILQSRVGVLWSQYLSWTGGDPNPFLTDALESAHRAVEIAGDSASAHAAVGTAYGLRAEYLGAVRTSDLLPDLEASIASYEQALERSPNNPIYLNMIGAMWSMRSRHEFRTGFPDQSRESADRAISNLETAVAARPRSFDAQYNLANILGLRCDLLSRYGEDFGPCLERLNETAQRVVELNPEFDLGHLEVGSVAWRRADYLYLTGGDPEPALQEAESWFGKAVALNPDLSEVQFRWSILHYYRAYYALLEGRDPKPHIEAARERADEAQKIRAADLARHAQGLLLDTMALRTALRDNQPVASILRDADGHLEGLLGINYRDSWIYTVAADYLLWRSYGEILRGGKPSGFIDRGESLIREGLETEISPATLTGLRGAFRLLRSHTTRDEALIQQLEHEAEIDFRRALEINRWIARDLEPWLAEVDPNLERRLRLESARR
ncbi:MAG: protein kinase [Deltaproteobacteria bacterium]|nr:protein kinase [Deltaproteobacteria bacterium]